MPESTCPALAALLARPPVPCRLCGDPVHRVPTADDEWAWADESGSWFGLDADLRRNLTGPVPGVTPDPYQALAWIRDHGDIRQYAMLKVRLDLGGPSHQHIGEEPADAEYPPLGPLPWHCGRPGWLRPSGYECRQCKTRLNAGESLAEQPAVQGGAV